MASSDTLADRITHQQGLIRRLLNPGSSNSAYRNTTLQFTPVDPNLGGNKYLLASKLMKSLRQERMGLSNFGKVQELSLRLAEKSNRALRMLHLSFTSTKENNHWSEISKIFPSKKSSSFESNVNSDTMSQGSVLQKFNSFPQPGQSLQSFKDQVSARPNTKVVAKGSDKRTSPGPTDRLFTKVQEITDHSRQNAVPAKAEPSSNISEGSSSSDGKIQRQPDLEHPDSSNIAQVTERSKTNSIERTTDRDRENPVEPLAKSNLPEASIEPQNKADAKLTRKENVEPRTMLQSQKGNLIQKALIKPAKQLGPGKMVYTSKPKASEIKPNQVPEKPRLLQAKIVVEKLESNTPLSPIHIPSQPADVVSSPLPALEKNKPKEIFEQGQVNKDDLLFQSHPKAVKINPPFKLDQPIDPKSTKTKPNSQQTSHLMNATYSDGIEEHNSLTEPIAPDLPLRNFLENKPRSIISRNLTGAKLKPENIHSNRLLQAKTKSIISPGFSSDPTPRTDSYPVSQHSKNPISIDPASSTPFTSLHQSFELAKTKGNDFNKNFSPPKPQLGLGQQSVETDRQNIFTKHKLNSPSVQNGAPPLSTDPNSMVPNQIQTQTFSPTPLALGSATSANMVQRMWSEHSESTDGSSSSASSTQEQSNNPVDFENLAQKILPLVKQLMEIDLERTGSRFTR